MTITVSSGEFLKAYGRMTETALREPVSITSHGRERLVLISADEYRRLKTNDRQPLYPWEMDDAMIAALETAQAPEETKRFDNEIE